LLLSYHPYLSFSKTLAIASNTQFVLPQ